MVSWYILMILNVVILITDGINLSETSDTLILVHVLFRHGDRTPVVEALYPNDPHQNEDYYPFGYGELTTRGKRREYDLGRLIRGRYRTFLGDIYTPTILDARSTKMSRTEMSLQLVLAGLFPPRGEEIWLPMLNWQPIPYSYDSNTNDKYLWGLESCSNFLKYFEEHMQSDKIQKINENYSEIFDYIAQNAGYESTTLLHGLGLYSTLRTEKEWGLKLPEWTKKVYPEPLRTIAGLGYEALSGTTEMKQILSGYLLEKIISDSKAKIKGEGYDTKIFLYSAHDANVGGMLNTLNVFEPHPPPYGSSVFIEVHKIKDQYGIKIFYENDENVQTGLLTIPGCEEFCPLEKFVSLVSENLPKEGVCGSDHVNFYTFSDYRKW